MGLNTFLTILRFTLPVVAVLSAGPGMAMRGKAEMARTLIEDTSPAAKAWTAAAPGTRIYRAKDDPKDLGWAIADKDLTVARVRLAASGSETLRTWDFAAMLGPAAGEDVARSLHPTLYPVGRGRFAMAVLTRESTMYSGGGATWTWAAFFELADSSEPDEVTTGRLLPLYTAIPFACSKDIRACFSEQEYRRATRCNESWTGTLRLRIADADKSGNMAWSATWEETHIPGGVTREKMEVKRTKIDLAKPPTTQCTEPM